MLHFLNFQKFYGNFLALAIEDLTLEPGIYWIKGTNGSGKSTFLKAIAGILSFKGDIILHKHISLKKQAVAYRQRVNFADAEPVFPDFLTGKELLDVFASAKQAPTGQATYFIQSMRMQTYVNQPISAYSSGMLKKLSLVAAFLGNPAVILLDEPLITMDAESLQILYLWITDKYQQQQTSFLLSSHQPIDQEALAISKEILIQNQTVHE